MEASDTSWLNPSSPYRAAAEVHVRLESAREGIAGLLGVLPERLIFNSGATEGNNAIFAYWAESLPSAVKIGVSPTEHPSVLEAAKRYFGARVVWLALDSAGAIDLKHLAELVESKVIAAVSVMAANNETGILNPWQAIAEICHRSGCWYHCDASQWLGKMPTLELGKCDFLTGCAHKFGGPNGVGFCLLPSVNSSFSSLVGGVQELGRRAGTEDVPGVLAMYAALKCATERLPESQSGMDDFFISIRRALPELQVVGLEAPRLWNTVSLLMPEFTSVRWVRGLERRGFLVSSGSACSTGKTGGSHVLAAMGYESGAVSRVLRISSGRATREVEWRGLAVAVIATYEELKEGAAGSTSRVISI